MHSKRTMIVANWKMNMTVGESSHLSANMHKHISGHRDIEVVLAPSFLSLQPLSLEIDRRRFRLASQNGHEIDEGGYTGEVSFAMMRDLVHYAIIGHSSRRIYSSETNKQIRDKVAACIRNGISPILCVGETATEKAEGHTRQVVHDQLTVALSNVTPGDLHKVIIAYEPVWAISTFGGKTSNPEDMKKMFDYIKSQLADLYGERATSGVRLLYGGSADNANAGGYLALDGCDGLLVGSASLNYHKFAGIVDVAYKINRSRSQQGS